MRAAFLVLLVLVARPVQAQSADIEGVVRGASAYAGIVESCAPYFALNGPEGLKHVAAFMQLAEKLIGRDDSRELLRQEFVRRKREIRVTGPKQWCAARRAIQQSGVGPKVFLD